MATTQNAYLQKTFKVVHPLDDALEQKRESEGLGPIKMTRTVKTSLMVLRGYLILMTLMLVYHVIDLAGIVGGH